MLLLSDSGTATRAFQVRSASDRKWFGVTRSVTRALIAANVVVFIVQMLFPGELVLRLGFVPKMATRALRGEGPLLTGLAIPAVGSLFLHGGVFHLLLNMWALYMFGERLEVFLGRARFALFYLFCGLAGTSLHYLTGVNNPVPVIGASGAVSGVVSAYAICWPRARIRLLFPPISMYTITACALWLAISLIGGMFAVARPGAGNVAHWAHVGGLLAGIGVMKMLNRRPPDETGDDWWRGTPWWRRWL